MSERHVSASAACVSCHSPVESDAQFCAGCGVRLRGDSDAALQRYCPRCGRDTSAHDRFCAACGASLEVAAKTTARGGPPAEPDRAPRVDPPPGRPRPARTSSAQRPARIDPDAHRSVAALRNGAVVATLVAVAAVVWAVVAASEELQVLWEIMSEPGGLPPDFIGPFFREIVLPPMVLPLLVAGGAVLTAAVLRSRLQTERARMRAARRRRPPSAGPDDTEQVRAHLFEHGPATTVQLAEALGRPAASVRAALRHLDSTDQVDQDAGGRWLTTDPG